MFAKSINSGELIQSQPRTRTLLLSEGDADSKRQQLLDYFQATFDQYELLFETLACDQAWYEKAIPLRHPLIFYFGHTACFYINKLHVTRWLQERIDPDIEAMVAIGVDEMSWDDLDDKQLPLAQRSAAERLPA